MLSCDSKAPVFTWSLPVPRGMFPGRRTFAGARRRWRAARPKPGHRPLVRWRVGREETRKACPEFEPPTFKGRVGSQTTTRCSSSSSSSNSGGGGSSGKSKSNSSSSSNSSGSNSSGSSSSSSSSRFFRSSVAGAATDFGPARVGLTAMPGIKQLGMRNWTYPLR